MPKRAKKTLDETFGQRLCRIRKQRGVTQVELAEAVGLAQSNISDYERDVYRPNSDMLLAIASKLKVSADEILGLRARGKDQPIISRRLLRRVAEIEKLPRRDQDALLRTIDAFLSKSA
ncbi:MAG: helix-turn-helix transcriptional regulator [Myxococcota bacterium]